TFIFCVSPNAGAFGSRWRSSSARTRPARTYRCQFGGRESRRSGARARFRARPSVRSTQVGTILAPMSPTPQRLVLDDAYHWERSAADTLYTAQTLGGGRVETFTGKPAMDQARRVASYLESLDLPPKSQVALVSKNTAWWLISDLAIWMAGHVSAPIYPTESRDTIRYVLEHSESTVVFFGQRDSPDE